MKWTLSINDGEVCSLYSSLCLCKRKALFGLPFRFQKFEVLLIGFAFIHTSINGEIILVVLHALFIIWLSFCNGVIFFTITCAVL